MDSVDARAAEEWLSNVAQEATPRQLQEMDSVEIGLLTCSPGKEIYSLYGHTAIRVRDAATGQDVAVNYGLFNYHTPHFIPRFVFGLCDYEMGIYPYDLFLLHLLNKLISYRFLPSFKCFLDILL